jgi:hypothetical protein
MTTIYLSPEEVKVLGKLLSLDLEKLSFTDHEVAVLEDLKTEVEGPTDESREHELGWDCPASPDKKCHYYTTKEKKVVLNDGRVVDPPKGHDFEYETDDSCIFCGEPEERK